MKYTQRFNDLSIMYLLYLFILKYNLPRLFLDLNCILCIYSSLKYSYKNIHIRSMHGLKDVRTRLNVIIAQILYYPTLRSNYYTQQ